MAITITVTKKKPNNGKKPRKELFFSNKIMWLAKEKSSGKEVLKRIEFLETPKSKTLCSSKNHISIIFW
jgi:hypothetical protein